MVRKVAVSRDAWMFFQLCGTDTMSSRLLKKPTAQRGLPASLSLWRGKICHAAVHMHEVTHTATHTHWLPRSFAYVCTHLQCLACQMSMTA
eukprot:406529-Pelagomonas_calceolata.AAC.2